MKGRDLALALGAAVLVLLFWWPTRDHAFVYDDERFVVRNPAVTEGVPLADYFLEGRTLTGDPIARGAYRPLRTLLWRLVVAAGDGTPHPAPLRTLGLAVLAAGIAVVFSLGRRLGLGRPAAFAATAFFGLHPMLVESAVWISSLGDLLAFTLGASALLVFLHRPGPLRSAPAVGGLVLLAALGKESALVLPLVLALASLLPHQGGLRSRLGELLAAGVAAALALTLRAIALADAGQGQSDTWSGGALREMGEGILYYLGAFFLFRRPAFDLYWPPAPLVRVVAGWSILVAVAVGIAVLARRRRRRGEAPLGPAAFALAWAIVALLPVLQIAPLNIVVADRFFLVSAAALALALAFGLEAASRTLGRGTALGAGLLGLGALIGGAVAIDVRADWRDEVALWSTVVERNAAVPALDARPSSGRAHYNLGRALLARPDADAATRLRAFEEIRRGRAAAFGGGALLVKAALAAGEPAATLAAARDVVEGAAAGRVDDRLNLGAVLDMADRAAYLPVLADPAALTAAVEALGPVPPPPADPEARVAQARLLRLRARLVTRLGRPDEARGVYNFLLEDYGVEDPTARIERARLLAGGTDPRWLRLALEDYERGLAAAPAGDLRTRLEAERDALRRRLAGMEEGR
ncbi:MAG: hypothetical protein R3F20_05925 [Planctomycetota bacterium]